MSAHTGKPPAGATSMVLDPSKLDGELRKKLDSVSSPEEFAKMLEDEATLFKILAASTAPPKQKGRSF